MAKNKMTCGSEFCTAPKGPTKGESCVHCAAIQMHATRHQAPPSMKLSREEEIHVIRLIQKTWNVIAADLPHDMSEADTVEVVLDADYTTAYGRDPEADAWLFGLSYEEQDAMAMKALFR